MKSIKRRKNRLSQFTGKNTKTQTHMYLQSHKLVRGKARV